MATIFETEQTRRLARALDALPVSGGIGLLTGPNGVGKSAAVRWAMTARPRVRHLELPPAELRLSARGWFRLLARAVGLTAPERWTTIDIMEAVSSEITQHDLVLVLDAAEQLGDRELPLVRYLADQVPHLVLCGTEALRARVGLFPALATRVRLPVGVDPISEAELLGSPLATDWSADWCRETYAQTGGLWSAIWTCVARSRVLADKLGGSTRDLGADHARQVAAGVLLKVA